MVQILTSGNIGQLRNQLGLVMLINSNGASIDTLGSGSGVAGVPSVNGVTGAVTIAGAGSVTATTNGSTITLSGTNTGGGVTGPGSSTNNGLATWNGVGGTALNSNTVILSNNVLSNISGLYSSGNIYINGTPVSTTPNPTVSLNNSILVWSTIGNAWTNTTDIVDPLTGNIYPNTSGSSYIGISSNPFSGVFANQATISGIPINPISGVSVAGQFNASISNGILYLNDSMDIQYPAVTTQYALAIWSGVAGSGLLNSKVVLDSTGSVLQAPVISGNIISGNTIYRQGVEINSIYAALSGASFTGQVSAPIISGTTLSGNNVYINAALSGTKAYFTQFVNANVLSGTIVSGIQIFQPTSGLFIQGPFNTVLTAPTGVQLGNILSQEGYLNIFGSIGSSNINATATIDLENRGSGFFNYPEIALSRSRGTFPNVSGILSGDILGQVGFWGAADGSGNYTNGGYIRGIANENYLTNNGGTRLDIGVVAIGTTGLFTKVSIDGGSGLGYLGTQNSPLSGLYVSNIFLSGNRLNIGGGLAFTGGAVTSNITPTISGTLSIGTSGLPFNGVYSNQYATTNYLNAGMTGVMSIDWNRGASQKIDYTGVASGVCTLSLLNGIGGSSYVLTTTQNGSGTVSITWGTTVKWLGGISGALTASSGTSPIDMFNFYYDGSNWLGGYSNNFF